ncbi:protein unc-93 homolog A-like [Tubulanus polymorphus]|uniref:protein unc-93 homolog A-like n=1 Tax=Tubulanus polymorphus TaxID=672921 RepID=UPI003DA68762
MVDAGEKDAFTISSQSIKSTIEIPPLGVIPCGVAGAFYASMDNIALSTATLNQKQEALADMKSKLTKTKLTFKEKICRMRGLLVLSISIMLMYTAYNTMQNLSSSLYSAGGLGLIALSSIYASGIVSCIFAPVAVGILKPTKTIFLCTVMFLIFITSHFYPKFYILVPGSLIVGLSIGPLWISQGFYLTTIAWDFAEGSGDLIGNVICNFNCIFTAFIQLSQLWGNVIMSTIFQGASDSENGTKVLTCGAWQCPSDLLKNVASIQNITSEAQNASYGIPELNVLILLVILISLVVGAMLLVAFGLEQLDMSQSEGISHKDTVLATFRLMKNSDMICILAVSFWTGSSLATLFGEFTQAYVSCELSMGYVGFTMLCFGVFGSVFSYMGSGITKIIGRPAILCTAYVVNLGLMVFLLVWQPNANQKPLFFVIPGLWGICDSIWQPQVCTLIGLMFPTKAEAAFANYRLFQNLGLAITFGYGRFMCVWQKLYVGIGVMTLGMILLLVVEWRLYKRQQKYSDNDTGEDVAPRTNTEITVTGNSEESVSLVSGVAA